MTHCLLVLLGSRPGHPRCPVEFCWFVRSLVFFSAWISFLFEELTWFSWRYISYFSSNKYESHASVNRGSIERPRFFRCPNTHWLWPACADGKFTFWEMSNILFYAHCVETFNSHWPLRNPPARPLLPEITSLLQYNQLSCLIRTGTDGTFDLFWMADG